MADLTIKSVPSSISKESLAEAFRTLGLEPGQLRRITLDAVEKKAHIELRALNEEGKPFGDAYNEVAVFKISIPLDI
jgi:hypothetical protein